MRALLVRVLAVVALAASGVPGPAAAVPVVGGSPNVELIAQIPDIQFMGARIVGRTMYATGTAGLRIYDLADPELPVLVGALPLEIFSNEDVDVSVSRKFVLISSDQGGQANLGAGLWIVDVLDPRRPLIKGFLPYLEFFPDGVGHIANCVADCARYAYVTGADAGRILVVDLLDPANPKPATFLSTPAGREGGLGRSVHDVNVDPTGRVWITGTGGIFAYEAAGRETNPLLTITTRPQDNEKHNQFIMHNSLLLDDGQTLLVTEEDWINLNCNGGNEGSFQTWRLPAGGTGNLTPLDQWTTERMGTWTDGRAAAATFCSSHWFDVNRHRVVAVAWYQQGIRFLRVSDPSNITQVGYYIPPWETAGPGVSMALFATDEIVYGMSLTSGLIVLRISGGGAGAPPVSVPANLPRPPALEPLFGFEPHPLFGWACAVRVA